MRSIITGPWGNVPGGAKVLFALMEAGGPINRKALRDGCGIYYGTMSRTLEEFDKLGLVKIFRKGNSKMARINEKNEIVKAFRRLENVCAKIQMIQEL